MHILLGGESLRQRRSGGTKGTKKSCLFGMQYIDWGDKSLGGTIGLYRGDIS